MTDNIETIQEIQAEQAENQAELIKEEILNLLESSKTIEDSVIQTLNETTTFGKTFQQWHKDLHVPVDPAADPAKVNRYCSQLSANLDTAYRNLYSAKGIYFHYNLSYNSAFNDKVKAQALSKNRKTTPALDTMSKVAEGQLGIRVTTLKRLEHVVEFWQGLVFKLKDQIDLVKTIAMSNGTRYKIGEF